MICYPVLPQYSLTFGAQIRLLRHVKPGSGISFIAAIPEVITILRVRGSAGVRFPRPSPDSPGAPGSAGPGGRGGAGARRRSRRDRRILYRSGRSGSGVERHHSRGRPDPSLAATLGARVSTRFSSPHHRAPHIRSRRSHHHRRYAGIRDTISARLSASASASGLRGQRRACGAPSSERASAATPAHAIFFRRRASVRAARQRHQVLLVALTLRQLYKHGRQQ